MGGSGDLVGGLAQLMEAGSLAVYRPEGPAYTTAETGITISTMPDAPNRLICLTPYSVNDTDLTDAITGVQVRMRAGTDPRALLDLSDGVFDLLHNRRGFWLGDVFVALCWRQSEAPMGQDAHGRDERSANYYLQVSRTASHLYE